jgi:hypothetical protein
MGDLLRTHPCRLQGEADEARQQQDSSHGGHLAGGSIPPSLRKLQVPGFGPARTDDCGPGTTRAVAARPRGQSRSRRRGRGPRTTRAVGARPRPELTARWPPLGLPASVRGGKWPVGLSRRAAQHGEPQDSQ